MAFICRHLKDMIILTLITLVMALISDWCWLILLAVRTHISMLVWWWWRRPWCESHYQVEHWFFLLMVLPSKSLLMKSKYLTQPLHHNDKNFCLTVFPYLSDSFTDISLIGWVSIPCDVNELLVRWIFTSQALPEKKTSFQCFVGAIERSLLVLGLYSCSLVLRWAKWGYGSKENSQGRASGKKTK